MFDVCTVFRIINMLGSESVCIDYCCLFDVHHCNIC